MIPVDQISYDFKTQRYDIVTAELPPRLMSMPSFAIQEICTPVDYHIQMPEEPADNHNEILTLLEEP